jgi:hypothetical protein
MEFLEKNINKLLEIFLKINEILRDDLRNEMRI